MFLPQSTELHLRAAQQGQRTRTSTAATSSQATRTSTAGSARTPTATSSRSPSPSWSATTRETTADGPAPDTPAPRTTALQDLFAYPLMSCLQDRRTRRVAQGVSLKAGDMSYESANEPSPLSPLEEAILIAGDRADRRRHARRAAGQAQRQAGARHAVPARHRPRGLERRQRPGDVDVHDQRRGHLAAEPPQEREAMEIFNARCHRAGRTAPRTTGSPTPTRSSARSTTSAWSSRASGRTTSAGTPSTRTRPGTTCFLPVVDNTRQYINVLLILLRAEGHGAALHGRLAPVPPVKRAATGSRGRRRSSASSTRSRTTRSAASSACAAGSSTPDTPAPTRQPRQRCAPTTRRTSCCRT